jgi:hypothetical protein
VLGEEAAANLCFIKAANLWFNAQELEAFRNFDLAPQSAAKFLNRAAHPRAVSVAGSHATSSEVALPFLGTTLRTAVYVDGFNLFHSLPDGRRGVKWLDLRAMAQAVLQPSNKITLVRYFTARVTAPPNDPDMPTRQDVYLRALKAQGVVIHHGMFKERAK